MSAKTNKIVSGVISSLKKLPAPGKKSGSFWDFMKSQLSEEGTWSQSHLQVIEKEIEVHLNKLDKNNLSELWKKTNAGIEKSESDKKVELAEMKEDLTDDLMGEVMDRMDDNYSSRDSYFTETSYVEEPVKKESNEEGFEEETEPDKIDDEELNLDDDELFDDEFDDEDDTNF